MRSLLLLLLVGVLLPAVEWQQWEAGRQAAKASGKPMLVEIMRDGCHYCSDMEEQVFNDAATGEWVESCFIPVKVNLSKGPSPLEREISMTPTFAVVAPDGQELKVIPGSWSREDFRALTKRWCKKD